MHFGASHKHRIKAGSHFCKVLSELFVKAVARPENEPLTPLAKRLREVRRILGDPERGVFGDRLGVPKSTLAFYERGERTPDADTLRIYSEKCQVDLNWLITGEGDVFRQTGTGDDRLGRAGYPPKIHATIDSNRLERAISLVERGLDEAGRTATPEGRAGMISAAYELLEVPSEATIGRILRLVKG